MTTTALSPTNRYGFGIGTIGRDAVFTLVTLYLFFYLTDVLRVSTQVLAAVTVVIVVARIFDAINDPFMGVIVDNTRTRWGKFKPWIAIGAAGSALLTVALFTDFGLTDTGFIALFAVLYIGWGITFTMNDISFWSMLPALTRSQAGREKVGAFARICANIGAFGIVVAIVPVSQAIAEATGSMRTAYTIIAIGVAALLLIFQVFMLIVVKEDRTIIPGQEPTRFADLVQIIFRNDQLLPATASLLLFVTAETTTISLGLYYFKYVFGDEGMYMVFAAVLGVAQLGTLALYPVIAKRFSRTQLFTAAIGMVASGYVVFLASPDAFLPGIVVAGLLIFSAQAIMQVLCLMFITDSVDYGQWKFGRRNDSVTLSLQPFINKMGGAIASGVVGATVIVSGMNLADGPGDMTTGGITVVKVAMFVLPLILTVCSYLVYRRWYTLDETRFAEIVADLTERAEALS